MRKRLSKLADRIRLPRRLAAALGVLVLGLGVGVLLYVRAEGARLLTHEQQRLDAIAGLKLHQLLSWRAERLGDAAAAVENPLVATALAAEIGSPDPALEADLAAWALSIERHSDTRGVYVVARDGTVRFAHGRGGRIRRRSPERSRSWEAAGRRCWT